MGWARLISRLREANSRNGRRSRGLCPIWCTFGLGGSIRGLGGLVLVLIGGFQGSYRLQKRRKVCEAWLDKEEEWLSWVLEFGEWIDCFIENCVNILGRESKYLEYSRGLDSIGH